MRTSLLSEFLDLLSPRVCTICERRLAADEPLICSQCMSELPVTPYCESPYDNWMARLFWGQFPVEKVSAWIFFRPVIGILLLVAAGALIGLLIKKRMAAKAARAAAPVAAA